MENSRSCRSSALTGKPLSEYPVEALVMATDDIMRLQVGVSRTARHIHGRAGQPVSYAQALDRIFVEIDRKKETQAKIDQYLDSVFPFGTGKEDLCQSQPND